MFSVLIAIKDSVDIFNLTTSKAQLRTDGSPIERNSPKNSIGLPITLEWQEEPRFIPGKS